MKGPAKSAMVALRGVVVILAVLGVVAVAVVAGANLGIGTAADLLQSVVKAEPATAHAQEKVEHPTRGVMYSTAQRVVNLTDKGTMRYLKAQVVLEIAKVGEKAEVEAGSEAYKKKQEELRGELVGRSVAIDDEITMILSGKTATELITPEGKVKLKQELKDRLGELVGDRQILNVYFTEFIIQ